MPNHHLSCGALDDQIPKASDGIPWCECENPEVELLCALVAAGMSQWDASLLIWGSPDDRARVLGFDVRLWVRARFAAAFPWLVLPPLEGAAA